MEDSLPGTRVVHHHSELGWWEMVMRDPHPRLRAFIQSYQGYIESTPGLRRRLEPPSTTVVLIIGLGPALGAVELLPFARKAGVPEEHLTLFAGPGAPFLLAQKD